MKKFLALPLCLLMLLSLLAGCGGSKEVTWADYQAWLIESFADTSPNPDNFKSLVESIGSWEELDTSLEPWNKILGDEFFNGSTWDEFVAAGGVGSFNKDFVDDTSATGEPPSGEPSGEPAA